MESISSGDVLHFNVTPVYLPVCPIELTELRILLRCLDTIK